MSMISEQIEELRLMAEMFVNGEPYGNLLRRAADTIEMLSEKAREPNCSEKPNNCDTCRNKGFEGCEQPCLGCGCCGLYESKDEPLKTVDYCDICKQDMCKDCIADATNPYCVPSHYEINYEPKDEPKTQMKTQNLNLTLTEGVWNAGYKTGYDKGYKDAQKVKDRQDLVKDLVKAFGEDGTWLERKGVYTLTLAEAKQRAVDIIEAVLRKDEADTPQTERSE